MEWIEEGKGRQKPIYSWCKYLEENASKQAIDLSIHPHAFHHIALMADCHAGQGMPIGGVLACERVIIPSAVGADIGCGMIAVKTGIVSAHLKRKKLEKIIHRIEEKVPVGPRSQPKPIEWHGFDRAPDVPAVQTNLDSARVQLGTLGGGNHFIEIQKGDDGFVWLMVHSGSRHFGYKVAEEYNKIAIEQCEGLGINKGLAYLVVDSKRGEEYIEAMQFALSFAARNREMMMREVLNIVDDCVGCEETFRVAIHHNYAAQEHHFGKDVWIHRKGATSAQPMEYGIIPGTMGTNSYIVRGLGNADSFRSCSHGAGRVMARSLACRKLDVEQCDKKMNGIVFSGWKVNRRGHVDLSEAPQAYKDIGAVMNAQEDLVTIVHELTPIGVVKG